MEKKKLYCRRAGEFKPEMIKTSEIIEDLMASVKPETFIKWVRNDVLSHRFYDYSITREFKAKYPNYSHNSDERSDSCKDVKRQLEQLGFIRTDDVLGTMNSLSRFSRLICCMEYEHGKKDNEAREFYSLILDKKDFPTAMIEFTCENKCMPNSIYEVYDEDGVKEQFSDMLHCYLTPMQYELVAYILFEHGGYPVVTSSIEQDILEVASRQVYYHMPELVLMLEKSLF